MIVGVLLGILFAICYQLYCKVLNLQNRIEILEKGVNYD